MNDLKNIANPIAEGFKKFFSKRSANASARKTNFTQRKPKKLNGFQFLVAMTLGRFKKSGQ